MTNRTSFLVSEAGVSSFLTCVGSTRLKWPPGLIIFVSLLLRTLIRRGQHAGPMICGGFCCSPSMTSQVLLPSREILCRDLSDVLQTISVDEAPLGRDHCWYMSCWKLVRSTARCDGRDDPTSFWLWHYSITFAEIPGFIEDLVCLPSTVSTRWTVPSATR